MCDEPDFNVDSLRHPHESPTEWNLRRKFLLAHKDSLPRSSLLCMASCFINVELSGCTYPPAVMERVRGLAEAVKDDVESHRDKVKARTEVKFVKASNTSQLETSKSGVGMSTEESLQLKQSARGTKRAGLGSSHSAAPNTNSGISFVKSNDSYSTTTQLSAVPPKKAKKVETPIDPKFLKYIKQVKECIVKDGTADAMSVLHMARDKVNVHIQVRFSDKINGQFNAKILLDFVLVAEGSLPNKKMAKRQAAENAVGLLCKEHLRIVPTGSDELMFEGSDRPFDFEDEPHEDKAQETTQFAPDLVHIDSAEQRTWGPEAILKNELNFALHEHESDANLNNAANILHHTSAICGVPIEFDCKANAQGVTCMLRFGHIYTGTGEGTNEKEAKKDASKKAVIALRKYYYTIQAKKRADIEDGISVSEKSVKSSAIPDSNIGNKLLKMMGWAGGGIGKEGQGIAEPVSVDSVINREGLGLGKAAGRSPEFKQKVQHMLEDYIRKGDEKDLVFTADLTNEERKVIHQMGKKLGLKTKSYNKNGETRYLVVSKKVSWLETFHTLQACGGENDKYRLIAPGQHELPADDDQE